jgi:hypothetical protein
MVERNFHSHRLYGDWTTVIALWNSIVRTIAKASELPQERLGPFMDSPVARKMVELALTRNMRTQGGYSVEDALDAELANYGGRNIARRAVEYEAMRRQDRARAANESVDEAKRIPGAGGKRPTRGFPPTEVDCAFLCALREALEPEDGDPFVPHKVDEVWNETLRQIVDETGCTGEEARNVLQHRFAGTLATDILRARKLFRSDLPSAVERGLNDWMNFGYRLRGWVIEVNRRHVDE